LENPNVENSFQARLLLKEAEEHMDPSPCIPTRHLGAGCTSSSADADRGLGGSRLPLALPPAPNASDLAAQGRYTRGFPSLQGMVRRKKITFTGAV